MVAVADLPDVSLDYYVALAEGHHVLLLQGNTLWVAGSAGFTLYSPTRKAELANPIIDRQFISVGPIASACPVSGTRWRASSADGRTQAEGERREQAAMRVYVLLVFGPDLKRPPFLKSPPPRPPAGRPLPLPDCDAPDAWL